MIKALTAFIAAATLSIPVSAKVDPGTINLLNTLDDYGVTILYNPSTCSGEFQGQYTTKKVMTLCYSGQPTAADFDTIRHETFHFLQHCAAMKRGERGIKPLAVNSTKRSTWVGQVLSSGHIDQIKRNYPVHHHQVELEAFAAAYHYSANDFVTLIKSWCIK